MSTEYTVKTPSGDFVMMWPDDPELPAKITGSKEAVNYARLFMQLSMATGAGGDRLELDTVEPADLYGFCQSPEWGIEVIPSPDALVDYENEDNEADKMGAMMKTLDAVDDSQVFALIGEGAQLLKGLDTDSDTFFDDLSRLREIIIQLGEDADVNQQAVFNKYVADSGGDVFEAAKTYFKKELQGKIIKTVIDGKSIDVHLTGSGFKEMKRGMKSDTLKAKLIAYVPEILKTGKYDGRNELKKDRTDGYVAFHFFEKEVDIDGAIVSAGVNVGESVNSVFEYKAYGLGHEYMASWAKNKAASGGVLDAALVHEELFRGLGVPSEPTTKPRSTSSSLLTMDSILDEGSDGVNIVILKVIDKNTGERLYELEDDVGQEGHEKPAAESGSDVLGRPATIDDGMSALKAISPFLSGAQRKVIAQNMNGEEGAFFIEKALEMAHVIRNMPVTYGQDGLGDKAIVYLHYFMGSIDSYITEKDAEGDGTEQAFGFQDLQDLGYGGELGYINIAELVSNKMELDLYWEPKTLGAVKNGGKEPEEGDGQTVKTSVASIGQKLEQMGWEREANAIFTLERDGVMVMASGTAPQGGAVGYFMLSVWDKNAWVVPSSEVGRTTVDFFADSGAQKIADQIQEKADRIINHYNDPAPEWEKPDFDPTTGKGYEKIMHNEEALKAWQDRLDSYLQGRMTDVRNNLRLLGWEGDQGGDLSKGGITAKWIFKSMGSGGNIVGYRVVLDNPGKDEIIDDLYLNTVEFAEYINGFLPLDVRFPATIAESDSKYTQEQDYAPAVYRGFFVEFNGKKYPVDTLQDAQDKWIAFRDESGAGASQIGEGLVVTDKDGKPVARVSYNGRLWGIDGNLMREAPKREGTEKVIDPVEDPATTSAAPQTSEVAENPEMTEGKKYLQSVIDGSADMLDPEVPERFNALFEKFSGDAAFDELMNQAVEAYTNFAMGESAKAMA